MTSDILLSQLSITIGGQAPSAAMTNCVEQILVETSLHLPGVATLVLHDPALDWLDSATLEPGKELKILSGTRAVLFEGEIVEVEAELSFEGQRVIVRAFDRLHRLARGAHTRAFTQVSDSDIVQKCATEAGLSVQADTTPGQHLYFIQANETDLSMLQRRAAANGFLLYVEGQKLCFKKPAGSSTVELALGESLSVFRPRFSAAGYVEKTSVRGWNPQQKQAVVGKLQRSSIPPQIGLSARDYLSLTPAGRVANLAIQNQDEAKRAAQALTDAQISRFVEAEGVCLGNARIKAGVKVNVTGVGTRFSGSYLVTGATHRLVPGELYTTEFSVSGLNPGSLLGLLAPAEPAGQQALGGLTIGIVTDNKDPQHLGRVKVKFPLLLEEQSSQEMVTDWVRMAAPSAGHGRGFLFLPEVNDEVVVGFGQGDINAAFVLGALWNGQDKPPGDPNKIVASGKVNQRVIYSRTGHYIMLDDSDSGGGISIIDKKGNKIVLKDQDNSLTIETAGDIKLTTKGNLSMDVTGNAAFKAKGNISMEATGNLSLKATGNAEVNGTGGAKLESIAIVTVQGSMINLN